MASPSPSPSSSPPQPPPPSQDQNSGHQSPPSPSPPSNQNSPKPTTPASTNTKKTQPLPWTHQESINLIQAYQERWYSLKKGQLKADQWEEVAVAVAARCDYDEPSKSSTQCRHKIEKLRKRYRAERLKPRPNSWQYFDLMDRMERGPLPISAARPLPVVQYNPNNQPNSSGDSDLDYNYNSNSSKSKSINHIVRGGNSVNNVERGARVLRVSRSLIVKKRKEFSESDNDNDNDDDDDDNEEAEEEEGGEWSEMVAELAVEIRAFADKFVKMENKKIEMMRDTERYRMEMENKRMEVILESQQKLVHTIHKAFSSSHKKMKMTQ